MESKRSSVLVILVLLIGIGASGSGASVAHASTPSDFLTEIITPAGWELRTGPEHCAWRDVTSSGELVTPEGWGPHRGEEPTWGGCVYSDLVVPLEWRQAVGR